MDQYYSVTGEIPAIMDKYLADTIKAFLEDIIKLGVIPAVGNLLRVKTTPTQLKETEEKGISQGQGEVVIHVQNIKFKHTSVGGIPE